MSNPLVSGLDGGPLQTAVDIIPVTPSNDANLPTFGRAIRAQGAGSIHILTGNGNERTTPIGAGETLFVQVLKVFATGTTATGIEVLA